MPVINKPSNASSQIPDWLYDLLSVPGAATAIKPSPEMLRAALMKQLKAAVPAKVGEIPPTELAGELAGMYGDDAIEYLGEAQRANQGDLFEVLRNFVRRDAREAGHWGNQALDALETGKRPTFSRR